LSNQNYLHKVCLMRMKQLLVIKLIFSLIKAIIQIFLRQEKNDIKDISI